MSSQLLRGEHKDGGHWGLAGAMCMFNLKRHESFSLHARTHTHTHTHAEHAHARTTRTCTHNTSTFTHTHTHSHSHTHRLMYFCGVLERPQVWARFSCCNVVRFVPSRGGWWRGAYCFANLVPVVVRCLDLLMWRVRCVVLASRMFKMQGECSLSLFCLSSLSAACLRVLCVPVCLFVCFCCCCCVVCL